MRPRRPSIFATVLVVATFSLLATACGSSSPSSATVSGSGDQSAQTAVPQGAVAFADCMRSHGVTGFPDPSDKRAFKFELAPSTQHTPAFGPALAVCQHLMPDNGGQGQNEAHAPAQIAAFVAFAGCLRGHGFPTFPDPSAGGELTHEMLAAAGINIHQPAVLQAADACVGVTHGYITRVDVARFIAGQ